MTLIPYLDKDNHKDGNEVTLKNGWNTLDCSSDYQFSFRLKNNANLVTDIDMTHFQGDILGRSFMTNAGITSFTIPDTVRIIRNMAFQNVQLRSLEIPQNITLIQSSFLRNNNYIEEIIFPSGMNIILERGCLVNCAKLRHVILPDNMEVLERDMFKVCPKLKDITLSNNLERIELNAFTMCTSLETLTLPATIKYIAYSNNRSNLSLTILAKEPPTIESGWQFKEVLVPRDSINAYKNATNGWEQYKDFIKPIED